MFILLILFVVAGFLGLNRSKTAIVTLLVATLLFHVATLVQYAGIDLPVAFSTQGYLDWIGEVTVPLFRVLIDAALEIVVIGLGWWYGERMNGQGQTVQELEAEETEE